MGWFKRLCGRSVCEARDYTPLIGKSYYPKYDFIGEKKNMKFDFDKLDGKVIRCETETATRDLMWSINQQACIYGIPIEWCGCNTGTSSIGYFSCRKKPKGGVIVFREYVLSDPINALNWSDFMKDKKFTKADLKNGDVVKLRNGSVVIYIENLKGFIAKDYVYIDDAFTVDLKNIASADRGDDSHDIMQVRRPNSIGDCCFYAYDYDLLTGTLVYDRERDDPEIEEMTMEDVCKALGKRVKIVDRK